MNVLKEQIYKYLLRSGFSPVHKGFKLIVDAVTIIMQSEFKLASLSECVYKPLGERYCIAPFSVQKNIKNALDYAALNSDVDFYGKEFASIMSQSGSISCAAFLFFVADKLKFCTSLDAGNSGTAYL